LIEFSKVIFPEYEPQSYHYQIAKKLEAVERGEIKRLLITVPPQHGKSTLASKAFPAWYLGRNPDNRLILTSYGATLADEFGYEIRNIIADAEHFGSVFPDVTLAKDSKAKNSWGLDKPHRGRFRAVGVGGGVTGKPANGILIDDPVKGAAEADSPVEREKTWRWYLRNVYSRISALGFIVLVMTRWHEDDLAGRVLRNDKHGNWEILHLKALTTDEETGELKALWPERYPVQYLLEIKETDPRGFASLYQGEPTVEEGAIFKREWFTSFRRYTPELLAQKRFFLKVLSVDTAIKTGVRNDYSVIVCLAFDGIDYWLLDVWRGKVEFSDLEQALKDQYEKHKPDVLLIEDASSGQSVAQSLKRDTALPVVAVPTHGLPKTARAEMVSAIYRATKIQVPRSSTWYFDWQEEHLSFPTGTHDDQVDATAQGLSYIKERLGGGVSRPVVGGQRQNFKQSQY
jgi:predicted phage terminase large subunit-like protein